MIRTLISEGGMFDGDGINGCLIFFEAGLNDLAGAEAPLETELNDLVRSEEPLKSGVCPATTSAVMINEAESSSSSPKARLTIP